MIKGILFDFDGTLIDSMSVWNHVGDELLAYHQMKANEDLDKRFETMSLAEAASYLKEQYLRDTSEERIVQEVWDIVSKRYQTEVSLKPGVKHCLDKLESLQIKMGIVTAGEKHCTKEALRKHGILHHFDVILTCDEMKMSKRQPDIFLSAQKQMKLSIDELIVVDDAFYALQAAKQAGFICWAMFDESQEEHWEACDKICDQKFQTMKELEDFICTKL